ncbi:MAG: PilN domain-containing protein [Sterolibacterium sp.]|nr:PilN domain-containing protein [Sterolibacterium sp.]
MQLANELANARALLKSREEVVKVLESGAFSNTIGFAEFLRGFARQAPNGLWLTGFTIGAGGTEMEIRGRMLNPASLPEYIRRLKTEKVFQGRSFASLTIQRPEDGKEKKIAGSPTIPIAKLSSPSSPSSQASLPSYVDFVLMPSAPNPETPATTNAQASPPSSVGSTLTSGITSPRNGTSVTTASLPQPLGEKP